MSTRLIPLGLLALLAACGSPDDGPVDNRTGAADNVAAPDLLPAPTPTPIPSPTPTPIETPEDIPGPVASQAFPFSGDWAVNDLLCKNNGVWSFGRGRVVTDGETACAVHSISDESRSGATLNMSCVAEGATSDQRWVLGATEGGKMDVQRYINGKLNPPTISLQRCAG